MLPPEEGTLEHILNWILYVNDDCSKYMDFLLCYKYIDISALDLLGQIYEMYQSRMLSSPNLEALHSENWKIGVFLQKWILIFYYRDFCPKNGPESKRALHLLKAILRTFCKDGNLKEAEELQDTLSIAKNSPPPNTSALVITTIYSKSKAVDLIPYYTPVQVATQLTIIDFNMLRNISEDELCSLGWDKKDESKSPNVNSMVDRWNKVAMWVATEIITTVEKHDKRKTIKWFLSVAEKLTDLKNFHTLLAIIAGLNNVFVNRLLEMKTLGNKSRQRKNHLEILMNTDNNWGNYRERLKKSDGLVIPYLGLFMKDIFIVLEDRPKTHNGYFNFVKLRILQQVLSQFFRYRTQVCSFDADPILIEYLSLLYIKTDKELDELSQNNQKN